MWKFHTFAEPFPLFSFPVELIVHLFICSAREKLWGTVVQRREIGCLFLNTSPPQRHFVYNNYVIMKYV